MSVSVLKARAVLAEHGIDPNADVDTLMALLEARGWQVSLEQSAGGDGRRPARWSAHATLAVPAGSPVSHRPSHISIRGPDGRDVLTRVVARVLEKERAS